MTSTLKVDNIAHSGGTTGMTINSSGQVDLPQNNNISMFGLQANQNVTSTVTLTNWGQMNSQTHYGFKTVGSAMNVSSGIFTASKLGVYRVYSEIHVVKGSDTRWIQADIKFKPNGGSFIGGDIYDFLAVAESTTTYLTINRTRYYNFNHAGDECKLQVGSSQSLQINGEANNFDTMICFEWIAPAVA